MLEQTESHAVRWANRRVRGELDWTLWHWTNDSKFTLCGIVVKIATPVLMFPEMDEQEKVDCKQCLLKLKAV